MKYIKLVALALLLSGSVSAQTISRKVVAASGGYYSNGAGSLSWTLGETITPTLQAGGNTLSQGFQQPDSRLLTGTVNGPICAGSPVNVPYTAGDIFAGNTFTAELSDATGSFASPVSIGTVAGNASGVINCIIPVLTPAGSGYRIRVVSNEPDITAADNGSNIIISTTPPVGSCTVTSIPADACVGNVVAVSTNVVPGATGYTWSVPAGTLINGLAGPQTTVSNTVNITLGVLAPNSSGWLICSFASNACGNTNTNCKYIRGSLSMPAAITGSTVACPSTGPSNYSTSPVAGAASYAWSITGDASVSGTGTTAAVTFGPAFTSGTLCVRAELPCGFQSAQRCMNISNGTPLLGVMSGSFNVCPGTNGVPYSVPPSAGATTYNWTLPAGATIATGAGTNSITVDFGIGYTGGNVCVIATSICGINSLPRCKTIASNKPGTPGNISGTLNGVCGQTLTYTIGNVAGATSYTWTAPAGASLGSPNGTNSIDIIYPNGYSTGQLCVTANNACGAGTARCVNVKGTPAIPASISGAAAVCANDAGLAYSVTPVFGASSYVWTTPLGSTIVSGQGTNSIILDYGVNGGVIGVTANGVCGNSGTRTLAVTMNCKVSASEMPGTVISAYPNPVSSLLNIEMLTPVSGSYTFELLDLAGRIVHTSSVSTIKGVNSSQMDVSQYSKGMYMLVVRNSNGFEQQIRIAVE